MNARIAAVTPLLALLCSLLAACAGGPAPHTAAIPGANTVAVPADDSPPAQQLQRSLGQRGWSLAQYDSKRLQDDRDYARLARRARYRLTLSADRIGACRDGAPSFLYNIALIENRSGDVPLALTGASCVLDIVQRFEDGLDRKGLVAPHRTAQSSAPQ